MFSKFNMLLYAPGIALSTSLNNSFIQFRRNVDIDVVCKMVSCTFRMHQKENQLCLWPTTDTIKSDLGGRKVRKLLSNYEF